MNDPSLQDRIQGDMAAQLEVFSLIDNAHTTASELSQDAIVGHLLADHYEPTPLPGGMKAGSCGAHAQTSATINHTTINRRKLFISQGISEMFSSRECETKEEQ